MALKEFAIKFAAARERPYKLFDGGGLYLLVTPNGSKLWRMKYRFEGKEKQLCIGAYPTVSAVAARQKRREAKALLEEGVDPGAAKKEAKRAVEKLHLFEPIARAWHANRADSLDEAHAQRVLSRMERDVFPLLGQRDIAEITPPDVLEVVRLVEARGALDVSRRLKQGIGQVFRFAIACGWAERDPTTSINAALRPKPRVQHMARIPLAELPGLVAAIRGYDGEADPRRRETTRDALLITLLTWARTAETRFMTWHEVEDLDGPQPLWRVPAERMKMDREHLVPLPRQAVDILRRRFRSSNDVHVFPGEKPGRPISENTMIYACYRMGYKGRQTVHGFRGLASTWANEAEVYKSDWIEMALAHGDEDVVRGAYNSALYLGARQRMLTAWADFLLGDGQEVSRAPRPEAMKGEGAPRRPTALPPRPEAPALSGTGGRFGSPFWRKERPRPRPRG